MFCGTIFWTEIFIYLRSITSKVYKNPFVQSITILICIGWTSPYDVPVTPLPSSPLPLLLVLFQLVSFITEIPTKQSTSKLFESINIFFFKIVAGWRNGTSKTTEAFKQVSWGNSSHPGNTVGFDFRGKYLMYHKLYWFTFF